MQPFQIEVEGKKYNELFDSIIIIKCKDCKNRHTNWCPMHQERFEYNEDMEHEWIESDNTIDEGFCNFGESKT